MRVTSTFRFSLFLAHADCAPFVPALFFHDVLSIDDFPPRRSCPTSCRHLAVPSSRPSPDMGGQLLLNSEEILVFFRRFPFRLLITINESLFSLERYAVRHEVLFPPALAALPDPRCEWAPSSSSISLIFPHCKFFRRPIRRLSADALFEAKALGLAGAFLLFLGRFSPPRSWVSFFYNSLMGDIVPKS